MSIRPRLSSQPTIARTTLTAILCGLLIQIPAYAAAPRTLPPVLSKTAPLTPDERINHALNRLTFGPTASSRAEVRAMGLDRWFEQQLHPATIDDSALEARLAEYPAIQHSPAEMMARFPDPNILKGMAAGRLPLPADRIGHAIALDQIAFYKQRQENKAAGDAKGNTGKTAASGALQPGAATNQSTLMQADGASMQTGSMGQADAMGQAANQQATNLQAAQAQLKADQAAEQAADLDSTRALPRHDPSLYPAARTQQILMLAPDQRLDAVLTMPPAELAAFRRSLSRAELAQLGDGLSPEQRETLRSLQQGGARVIGSEVLDARLLRDLDSNRQLQAVMTDFWLNHFNVYIRKNQNEPYLLPAYERATILPHALGKFEDLLVATAQSPAMMLYLDNAQSIGPDSEIAMRRERQANRPGAKTLAKKKMPDGLNENYGRELMELHTLGVNGGYTQADVTEVAKVFTGWTIERPRLGDGGAFQFNPALHEPGPKTVLGHTIQQNGENEGLEVLHLLATSPATAHFLSQEIAIRFVSDTPPPALVDRMAKTYLASNGDISQVLRTMFHSPEFWSPATYRAKVKTPLEFVTSAVRASGADVADPTPLVQALAKLGMPLFGMQTPNGYGWTADDWVSTGALVNRMNFALVLADNRVKDAQVAWPVDTAAQVMPVRSDATASPVAEQAMLERMLLGEPAAPRTQAAVFAQLARPDLQDQAERQFRAAPASAPILQVNPKSSPATLSDDSGMTSGILSGKAGQKKRLPAEFVLTPVRTNAKQDPAQRQAALIAGLILGSPDFQRR
jgi:uncharacterized protein (DUF1800 family)